MDKILSAGVGVILLKDNKVLLGKRHEDPIKADSLLEGEGTWTLPGGKMEFGDSFEMAAAREVMEETGILVEPKNLKLFNLSNNISGKAQFVTMGLVASSFKREPKVMEPDEITRWEWFDLNELPKPLFIPSKKMIDSYLSGVFYPDRLKPE